MLGTGTPKDILKENAGGDDQEFEKKEESLVSLYKVSDASGTIKMDKINQKPIKQEMLDTNDCFIVEQEKTAIFAWIGKKASPKEKEAVIKKAEELKQTKKYPAWVKVQRVVELTEPTPMIQLFQTWKLHGETHSRLIRSIFDADEPCLESKLKLYQMISRPNDSLELDYIGKPKRKYFKSSNAMVLDTGCKFFVWMGKRTWPELQLLLPFIQEVLLNSLYYFYRY